MSNPETLELPCTLKLTYDPSRKKNYVHFTVPDVGTEVYEGENEERIKIGEVIGCIGGAVQFRVGEITYTLDTRALWRAVRDALQAQSQASSVEDCDPYDDPDYAQTMIERLSRGSKP